MFGSFWSALFGGLFGKKKKPGTSPSPATSAGEKLLPWKMGAPPGPGATFLDGGPAATPAPAAVKTPGLFTENGITYGEEALKLPREERVALDPEEIARRRKAFKPERSRYAAKRRETLLAGAPKA